MNVARYGWLRWESFLLLVLACAGPLGSSLAEGPPRAWMSRAGTTVTASLVRVDRDVVILKRADGVELRVPFAQLSDADQAFLQAPAPKPVNPFLPVAAAGDPAGSILRVEVDDGTKTCILPALVARRAGDKAFLVAQIAPNDLNRYPRQWLKPELKFTALLGNEATPRRVPLQFACLARTRPVFVGPAADLPPPVPGPELPALPVGTPLKVTGYATKYEQQEVLLASFNAVTQIVAVKMDEEGQVLGLEMEFGPLRGAAAGIATTADGQLVGLVVDHSHPKFPPPTLPLQPLASLVSAAAPSLEGTMFGGAKATAPDTRPVKITAQLSDPVDEVVGLEMVACLARDRRPWGPGPMPPVKGWLLPPELKIALKREPDGPNVATWVQQLSWSPQFIWVGEGPLPYLGDQAAHTYLYQLAYQTKSGATVYLEPQIWNQMSQRDAEAIERQFKSQKPGGR